MEEIWKPITEATNYEVSNLGRVRNTKTGKTFNPSPGGNGYKQVSLKILATNKDERRYVHRLVVQLDPITHDVIATYPSVVAACRALGHKRNQLDKALKKRATQAFGFHWKYLD